MTQRVTRCGLCLIALLILGAISACAQPALDSNKPQAPSATPTIPGIPMGWSVYRGAHYTIAYPKGWSYSTQSIASPGLGDGQEALVVFTGPQPRDLIDVEELDDVTSGQIPLVCGSPGQTSVQLAGLPMSYQVAEGVHRVWSFLTGKGTSYTLDVLDADQSAAIQAQHNAILATFTPDDTTPGCPS